MHPHTIADGDARRLACTFCGKSVSSPFLPIETEMGDFLIVRAVIACPECLEAGKLPKPQQSAYACGCDPREHYQCAVHQAIDLSSKRP